MPTPEFWWWIMRPVEPSLRLCLAVQNYVFRIPKDRRDTSQSSVHGV